MHRVYTHSDQTRNMGKSARLNPPHRYHLNHPGGWGGGADAGRTVGGGGGGQGGRCGLWYLGLYTHLRETRCNFPEILSAKTLSLSSPFEFDIMITMPYCHKTGVYLMFDRFIDGTSLLLCYLSRSYPQTRDMLERERGGGGEGEWRVGGYIEIVWLIALCNTQ